MSILSPVRSGQPNLRINQRGTLSDVPSNSSHTTSPVPGVTLTMAILARSSTTCPPIGISTTANKAFVGGAEVPGTTGSSVAVEEEPRDGSST